jgi:predicted lipoprotein with Yx(FWY)xxD motif
MDELKMRRLGRIAILAGAGVLAGVGCGGGDSGSGPDSAEGPGTTGGKAKLATQSKPPRSGLTIKAAVSQYGKVLFSGRNRAIYYFDKESTRRPECFGACAKTWPPALTSGQPRAGAGVKQGLLGTTTRAGGRRQVTYKGHPLYFYVNDARGDVGCHNVEEFGGLWLAVKPNGSPVS